MSEDFGDLQHSESDGFAVMAYTIIDEYQGADATVADVRRATETMSEDMRAGEYEWLIGRTYKTEDGTLTWDPEDHGWGREHADTFYEDAPAASSLDSDGDPISLTHVANGVADAMWLMLPAEDE